jgi:site-specific DNA recombinase
VIQSRYGIVGLAVGNGGNHVRQTIQKITALYPGLSHEDELQGESNSISSQKRIPENYAKQNGFGNLKWYTDV